MQYVHWTPKHQKRLYKVYIFEIYIRRAIQNTNFITRSTKIQSFKVYLVQVPCFTGWKLGHMSWPFSRKRLIETQRHLYQNKAKRKLCLTKKVSSNLVYSKTSYCKVKVPYQMTKKSRALQLQSQNSASALAKAVRKIYMGVLPSFWRS